MTEIELARKCGQSFVLGMAFMQGYLYARRGMAQDDDDRDIKFRKTDNNQTIAIKDGKVVGGAGTAVGPDKLPSFAAYREAQGAVSMSKALRSYFKECYGGSITGAENLKGLNGCTKLTFGHKGIGEMASNLTPLKIKAIPYIGYAYRTGEEINAVSSDHAPDVKFHYTAKLLKIEGHFYIIKLLSKQQGDSAEFSYYGMDKADDLVARHRRDAGAAFEAWKKEETNRRVNHKGKIKTP